MEHRMCNLLLIDDDKGFTSLVTEKLQRTCGDNLAVITASSFDEAIFSIEKKKNL